MSHPLSLSPASVDRAMRQGLILAVSRPNACDVARGKAKAAEQAENARKRAWQAAYRQRRRGGRPALSVSACGSLGGAPLSATSPEMLRAAYQRLMDGECLYQIARDLCLNKYTLRHHWRGKDRKPSRAMLAAAGVNCKKAA